MKKSEISTLLSYITRYTQRSFGPDDVEAWQDAADYAKWTVWESAQAARDLVNDPARNGPIQPVDVTRIVKAARQDAAMRAAATERREARAALDGNLARAIERGSGTKPNYHAGTDHLDAIYAAHGWSPVVRAAVQHKCPWCHEEPGSRCSRPSRRAETGRVDLNEPHPARIALTVDCPDVDCEAGTGSPCPHDARERLALGEAGAQRRKALVAGVRSRPSAARGEHEQRAVDAEQLRAPAPREPSDDPTREPA